MAWFVSLARLEKFYRGLGGVSLATRHAIDTAGKMPSSRIEIIEMVVVLNFILERLEFYDLEFLVSSLRGDFVFGGKKNNEKFGFVKLNG